MAQALAPARPSAFVGMGGGGEQDCGLTVQGRHEEVQSLAVQRQSGCPVAFLVLLHSLHHQGGLWTGRPAVVPTEHQGRTDPPKGPAEPPHALSPPLFCRLLTAWARLSALGMCRRSTQGWEKKSLKEMRRSGSRSRSLRRRSRQSRESGGRRGSCRRGREPPYYTWLQPPQPRSNS